MSTIIKQQTKLGIYFFKLNQNLNNLSTTFVLKLKVLKNYIKRYFLFIF